MKNIAIVEDENAAAEHLAAYIQRYAAEFGQQFSITRFCDGESFLQDYKAVYAVVFLDIQMPGKTAWTPPWSCAGTTKTYRSFSSPAWCSTP